MIPINNSDTAWLIVSDYNQENNKFYEGLREDVYNPNINDWIWVRRLRFGDDAIGGVHGRGVGAGLDRVGAGDTHIGGSYGGSRCSVGDNEVDPTT